MKKMLQLILVAIFLQTLVACCPTIVKEPQEVYVEVPTEIPETLLKHPCKAVGPGTTLNSLAKAYTANTTCIERYRSTLNGVIQYNKHIIEQGTGLGEKDDRK